MALDAIAEQTQSSEGAIAESTSSSRNLFEGPFPPKVLGDLELDSRKPSERVALAHANLDKLHAAYYGADDDFGDPLITLREVAPKNTYNDPANI